MAIETSVGEDEKYYLQMKDISMSFFGVKVLENVSLNVKKGTVHALMGENGAGKSTLMNILNGGLKPDSGEIYINGERVTINSPKEARDHGISMIHQELSSVMQMKVSENIFLGSEPCYPFFRVVNRKEQRKRTKDLLSRLDMQISPDARVGSLSIAEAQMVEIVKAISYNSEIIIMDEPTSAISDKEVEKLFRVIRGLTQEGKAIIYISHKMDEISQIADYITVLRDGKRIDTKPAAEMTNQKLISMMVGRELNNIFPKEESRPGEICLEVKDFSRKGKFEHISFRVRKGEILGIAGLMGAGRTELVETIFGMEKADGGQLLIDGRKVTIRSPKDAIRRGLAFISEDRKQVGLNLQGSIKDNMTLANLESYCNRFSVIQKGAENKAADSLIKQFNIKVRSRNQVIHSLSGGNQQKVVIAKWISCKPKIIIMDEPTRGIDVGSKSEIHRLMGRLAAEGMAVIMISSELPEVIGMSDRVIVMHEGHLTGEFERDNIDQEKIMSCATGLTKGAFIQ